MLYWTQNFSSGVQLLASDKTGIGIDIKAPSRIQYLSLFFPEGARDTHHRSWLNDRRRCFQTVLFFNSGSIMSIFLLATLFFFLVPSFGLPSINKVSQHRPLVIWHGLGKKFRFHYCFEPSFIFI
jgi:hypothetical protein